MTIRRASDADWPAVWGLLEPVFRSAETYAVDPNISEAEAHHYWIMRPHATYVLEHQGRICGTYYLVANQAGRGGHICNCGYVVDPEVRGQGLAARMCQHSQSEAVTFGFAAMQFNFVLSSNAGAVRLWQRLGFEIIGTIPKAYDHPHDGVVDAFIMYKPLT